MKSNSIFPCLIVFLATACLPCSGQLEDVFKQVQGAVTTEKAPDLRAQIGKWKAEAESELEKLERYTSAEDLPKGVSSSDLAARRRHLEQALVEISRHLIILDEANEPAEAIKAAKAEAAAWQGFETPPPHSVLIVDELVEQRDALEGKQASSRSSVEVFKTTLSGLLNESKAASELVDEVMKTLSEAPENQEAAQWKIDTTRAKQRSLFIRASGLEHYIKSLEDGMFASEVTLGLLSRKIKIAGEKLVFSAEDLARIKEASADRQAALRKESAEIRKRLRKAADEKALTASTLAKLKQTPGADPATLSIPELNADTASVTLEALQSISDALDSFLQVESFLPESYEHRFELMVTKDAAERQEALANLSALHQRLDAWEVVARNQLASVAADINKGQSRVSVLPADAPALAPLNRQQTIFWEKQAVVQRVYQAITNQRQMIHRWLGEYTSKETLPWYAPATKVISSGWDALKQIWNTPVKRYEETTELNGQKVVRKGFVSLGDIIKAAALFIIAYFIAATISRRVQRILIHRRLIGEAQARTLRNWLMLIVALLLALAALNYFKIPLTIFAFLAGALAIGVGFGTQTIIKNFISGIILLFERKVRVGDVIEVDGINGVVSEINTRSSIVRGANGIENLIPNSLLLENRVVNWTLSNRLLRRELIVRVALGSPSEKVMGILGEVSERHGLILKTPAPFAALSHFGDNSLDFTLFFWIELNDRTNGLMVDSDLRLMIEKRLEDCGIQTGITRAQPGDASSRRGELAQQDSGKPVIP